MSVCVCVLCVFVYAFYILLRLSGSVQVSKTSMGLLRWPWWESSIWRVNDTCKVESFYLFYVADAALRKGMHFLLHSLEQMNQERVGKGFVRLFSAAVFTIDNFNFQAVNQFYYRRGALKVVF